MQLLRTTCLLAALLATVTVAPAQACLVCIAMPADSVADKVAEADIVALLRPSQDNPFLYAPVAFLRGGPDAPDVPFLVSRDRGASMAADPSEVVVATWTPSDGWAIRDIGGPVLSDTLRAVLATDLTTPQARLDFFAPLVQSTDPALGRMAMIEMATLPYPVLRESTIRVDRHAVIAMLSDRLWAEWVPVMILMLGLSDDPDDIAFIGRAVSAMAQNGRTTNLGVWATALLEADSDAGLRLLQTSYFDNPDRSDVELRAIGLALASHAQRDDATGTATRAALADFAKVRPAVAGAIVQALMDREDWSMAPTFAQWLDTGLITGADDAFLITHYVLAAADAQKVTQP